MENITPFQEIIIRCESLDNQMNTSYRAASPTLEFSNSGRRGKKYFQIALPSLLQVFIDIKNNLTSFKGNERYHEKSWRDLYGKYLTDGAANALSTVQTLPLFAALSKIIHATNNLPSRHDEHLISLEEEHLNVTIDYLKTQISDEEDTPESQQQINNITQTAGNGENVIYYGAPGTGKSYTIEQLVTQENTIRTVFHADTQNNDFIGSLKPSIDENGDLNYAFQPGPFTEAYSQALNKPDEHIWLIIEEINRASASTVFGEIFQLLDRDESGTGSYQINAADPLWADYLKKNIVTWSGVLRMPSNLSLMATMNSSDQAVLPMDTAFKRRWKFHYIPLEFESACPQGDLSLDQQGTTVPWKDYAIAVNHTLTENHIPEDRHLGPFFLNEHDLSDESSALTGKLFMYLWDDVLRHGLRHVIFLESIKTYGQLITCHKNGEPIYNPEFLSLFDTESATENPDNQ